MIITHNLKEHRHKATSEQPQFQAQDRDNTEALGPGKDTVEVVVVSVSSRLFRHKRDRIGSSLLKAGTAWATNTPSLP